MKEFAIKNKRARLQENFGSDAQESSDGDRYEKEEPKARQARGTGSSDDDESEGVDSEQEKRRMDKLADSEDDDEDMDIDEEESSSGGDIWWQLSLAYAWGGIRNSKHEGVKQRRVLRQHRNYFN